MRPGRKVQKGYYYDARANRYIVRYKDKGVVYYIGRYENEADAAQAAQTARKYFPDGEASTPKRIESTHDRILKGNYHFPKGQNYAQTNHVSGE